MVKEEWLDAVENAWDDLAFAQATNRPERIETAKATLQTLYTEGFTLSLSDRVKMFLGLSLWGRDQIRIIQNVGRLTFNEEPAKVEP